MRCTVFGCDRAKKARGLCHLHYYRVKRLGHPGPAGLMQAPAGAGSIDNQGYRMHSNRGVRKAEHVLIAERALGKPLPAGVEVHHVDESRANNAPLNLVICQDHHYHALLHQRARAFDACGNANWRRCAICSCYDSPESMATAGGNALRHRDCFRAYERARQATNQ